MKKLIITLFVGLISVLLVEMLWGQNGAHHETEPAETIAWTSSTRQALAKEMQAITINYQTLVAGLAQGDWEQVVKQSHAIYSSFILKQELSEKDRETLHRILPARFIEMDKRFHTHAKKLAMAAKQHDRELTTVYAGRLLEGCVNCHSLYARERFPGLAEMEMSEDHGH